MFPYREPPERIKAAVAMLYKHYINKHYYLYEYAFEHYYRIGLLKKRDKHLKKLTIDNYIIKGVTKHSKMQHFDRFATL